jgi:hypothetical protein
MDRRSIIKQCINSNIIISALIDELETELRQKTKTNMNEEMAPSTRYTEEVKQFNF